MENKRELTYGEKAVGITFNPSNNVDVDNIKKLSAKLIDIMDNLRKSQNTLYNGPSEGARLCSIAITELQTAQMWAVKAVTWKE